MATEAQHEHPNPSPNLNSFNIGTRKSDLARIQTDLVISELKKAWTESQHQRIYNIHAISTMGDKDKITALPDFGAKSLWTFELEKMLIDGEIDFIVHSLKDVPTHLPPSLTLGAILERENPHDALCLSPHLPPLQSKQKYILSTLPPGSVIGTSSVRRTAQLRRLYPHLQFQSVRGNVDTRLRKLDAEDGPYAAIILAAAGLVRLNLGHRIDAVLTSGNADGSPLGEVANGVATSDKWGVLHAVGQGALGIEIREGDKRVEDLLKPIICHKTHLACLAERSLMRTLEGGCSVPIGVESSWAPGDAVPGDHGNHKLVMRATVVSVEGDKASEAELERRVTKTSEADEFGRTMARALLDKGAGEILSLINLNRPIVEQQAGGS